ncbi:hypothetical protein EIP91_010466 [Steccherinum ochraceum]|uniref:Methyltransferase type 11 domain-containing protein n=1 Tax=Steccherinum ochraceum TaxID=92696 RepID=A0A4R0RJG5_9APHY|nr:hypothetical protein EIP91_010466 [Steccherinum ochraceum]
MSQTKIHQTSNTGYGGSKSSDYDKVRHRYHPAQLDFMWSKLTKKENLNIAEMGAGTGLLTRALLAHPQWNAAISSYKCTDPIQGMRDVFSQAIQDARVSISDGRFEESQDIPSEWADAVLAATSFHWATDMEAAAKELDRILKPDGVIMFIWQMEDRTVPWVDSVWTLGESYQNLTGQTAPQFSDWAFQKIFTLPSYTSHFSPPQNEEIVFSDETTADNVVARFKTWSAIASMEAEQQEELGRTREGVAEGADEDAVDRD